MREIIFTDVQVAMMSLVLIVSCGSVYIFIFKQVVTGQFFHFLIPGGNNTISRGLVSRTPTQGIWYVFLNSPPLIRILLASSTMMVTVLIYILSHKFGEEVERLYYHLEIVFSSCSYL